MADDKKMFTQEQMTDAIKTVAKEVAAELAPVMMAATMPKGKAGTPQPFGSNERCHLCQQLKNACGGIPKHDPQDEADVRRAHSVNHVLLVVYPQKYPEFGEYFQGRKINGVRYLSSNDTHKVWVPRAAEGDIMRAVQVYEENERVTRMGRKREHHSGSLSNPKAANSGWR